MNEHSVGEALGTPKESGRSPAPVSEVNGWNPERAGPIKGAERK